MSESGFACPQCGNVGLNVADYDSMIVVAPDYALFTLHCPACACRVSSFMPIPASLREEVQFAAIEVGAGMGRAN